MNLKSKLLIWLIAFTVISATAGDYTRELHQGHLKSTINALEVTNKFGEVKVNDMGGDSVTVDVVITIESANESKAEYMLNQIEIIMQKRGSLLYLETKINDNFKSKQRFSIDYQINIPDNRNISVTNKFGNVAISSLHAKGKFQIDYGNLSAGTLEAPANDVILLNMSYGKSDIEDVNQMDCEIKYSKLFIGDAGTIKAESKYSGINADQIETLLLESKYDGINIDHLTELTANSKYSNYSIDKLDKKFVLNTEYGSVHIDQVAPNFELINITNSYGGISMDFSKAAFKLDAECDYCDIKLPEEEEFDGNRIQDGHNLSIKGTVGQPVTNSTVNIKSRYGGIKLSD